MPMSTSFRPVAVLDVLFKYASGRRPSRASYPQAFPASHDDTV